MAVEPARQWFGIYAASVARTRRSDNHVELYIPQVLGAAMSNWAVPLGTWFTTPPVPGTVVYAMFVGGDINSPVCLAKAH